MILLIAAGHGGPDPGAQNPFNSNYPEKSANLAISLELARLAVLNGHTAHNMRTTDIDWSPSFLPARAAEVNADVVVEVHCNSVAGGTTDARGSSGHTIPYTSGWNMADAVGVGISLYSGIPARGTYEYIWRDNTRVNCIDLARFPALRDAGRVHFLMESGFINNKQDNAILTSPLGAGSVAYGYLAGMHAVLNLPEPRTTVNGGGGIPRSSSMFLGLTALAVGGLYYYVYKETAK